MGEIYLRQNNRKPAFEIKRNFMNATKKYEIIKMAQENQLMLKRINERGSYYSKDKWQKDYEQSQAYKRNHCIYPSIDFYSTQLQLIFIALKEMEIKTFSNNLMLIEKLIKLLVILIIKILKVLKISKMKNKKKKKKRKKKFCIKANVIFKI